jgi:ABC-type multidrug transport system ATPase subunit
MIGCSGLGKRYGRRWLFRSLEITVQPGECLVILGQNGSGKSTLLKILAGILPPTEGTCSRPKDLRTGLGYAALDQAVYPALTVKEHLILAAQLRGCPDRADELLELIGLQNAGEAAGRTLSTGMRARLKLGLAVQANPAVVLLDEPGAGLDESGRNIVAEIIEHHKADTAFILATNDPLERRFATHELSIG